jgi:hypothetical protein
MNDMTHLLKIRQGVEAQLSPIVRQVVELVDTTKPEQRGMKTAQLDNFLGVTRETGSVAVVINWVRFQIGREQGSWHKQQFGETVSSHLFGWNQTAVTIAAEAYGVDEPTLAQIDPIWIELVRQYAGQLRRYFTYKDFQRQEEEKQRDKAGEVETDE